MSREDGINGQKVRCTIRRLRQARQIYELKQVCEANTGGSFAGDEVLEVLGTEAFKIGADTYRRCGGPFEF